MKKLVLGFCLAALAIAVGLAVLLSGRRPFAGLRAEDIREARVSLMPPDVEYVLTEEETEELAALLREVVLYRRDDSYREYSGQGVVFTLTMEDGNQVKAVDYNPFFVLDGKGYRTKYKPCEALNRFANQLRE